MGFKDALKNLGLALGLSLIVAMVTAYCYSRSTSDRLQVAERHQIHRPDGTVEVFEKMLQSQSESTRMENWKDGFERVFGDR